jgi:hypothetical protein
MAPLSSGLFAGTGGIPPTCGHGIWMKLTSKLAESGHICTGRLTVVVIPLISTFHPVVTPEQLPADRYPRRDNDIQAGFFLVREGGACFSPEGIFLSMVIGFLSDVNKVVWLFHDYFFR